MGEKESDMSYDIEEVLHRTLDGLNSKAVDDAWIQKLSGRLSEQESRAIDIELSSEKIQRGLMRCSTRIASLEQKYPQMDSEDDEPTEFIDDVRPIARDALEMLLGFARRLSDNAKEFGENTRKRTVDTADGVISKVKEASQYLVEQTTDAAEFINKTAVDTIESIAMEPLSEMDEVPDIFDENNPEGIPANVNSMIDTTARLTQQMVTDSVELANQMIEANKNEIVSFTNRINQAVGDIVFAAYDLSTTLLGEAAGEELFNEVVKKHNLKTPKAITSPSSSGPVLLGASSLQSRGIFDSISNKIGSAVDKVVDTANSVATAASNAAKAVVDTAKNTVKNVVEFPSKVANKVNETAKSVVDNIKEKVTSAKNKIVDAAKNVAKKVMDKVNDVKDTVNNVKDKIKNAVNDAVGKVNNFVDGVKNAAKKVADTAKKVVDTVKEIKNDPIGAAKKLANKVAEKAKEVGNKIVDKVKDVQNKIFDKVGDFVDDILGIGIKNADDIADDAEDDIDDIEEDVDDIGNEIAPAPGYYGVPAYVGGDDDAGEDGDVDDEDPEYNEMSDDGKIAADIMKKYPNDPEKAKDEIKKAMQQKYPNLSPEMQETIADLAQQEAQDYIDKKKADESDEPEYEFPDDEYDDSNDAAPTDNAVPPDPEKETTTPQANDVTVDNKPILMKKDNERSAGWKNKEVDIVTGVIGMMHDGDQQIFNPYGHSTGGWTLYSFRPKDTTGQNSYPQIAIIPSSFQALDSMNKMLDNIPYVVIKEYFFKNTASVMADSLKQILDEAEAAKNKPEEDSQGAQDADNTGDGILSAIKEKLEALPLGQMVIDVPYTLYCGLRKKLYGNTYIFPYLVQSGSTVINEASNSGEWAKNGDDIIGMVKGMIEKGAQALGTLAATLSGSQGRGASIFPAPTWNGAPEGNGVSFSFDLILINDNIVKARNNYMCVNTIIHNNRAIQKSMLQFPGALYEMWLPTGQRHLMCSADLKLMPLGLNRMTPGGFFTDNTHGRQGAGFTIGTSMGTGSILQNPHQDEVEVVPDAYKLSCTFKSCLANNMNTAVFQYYVKMTPYDEYAKSPIGEEGKDDVFEDVKEAFGVNNAAAAEAQGKADAQKAAAAAAGGGKKDISMTRDSSPQKFAKAVADLVDHQEQFDEATYNKKLGKLKSQVGDQTVNADSVISVIKNTQKEIRESDQFLGKLYDAKNNNLWYKPFEKEEYYTTVTPDYREQLRKQYKDEFKSLRSVDKKIEKTNNQLNSVKNELSEPQNTLKARNTILTKKLMLTRSVNALQAKRNEIVGNILQIDTQMIQQAFDQYDATISVKKNDLTTRIFRQVWNEKIMNSYERDRIQYMTSKEKERYFRNKIRELEKYDQNGILNHPDWFFRVVVIDYIVNEMKNLILWFKSCTYDDFETIYRIVRKLNLLHLDLAQAKSPDQFDINRTNLFYISEEDAEKFTDIDDMLNGNTLYELFKNQLKVKFVKVEEDQDRQEEKPVEDPVLVQEQKSELDMANRRKVRQDLITRYWGSETELTREAYSIVSKNNEQIVIPDGASEDDAILFNGTLSQLKDEIISLKLRNDESEQTRLRELLGSFSNQVASVKEALILEKMSQMNSAARDVVQKEDESIKAKQSE